VRESFDRAGGARVEPGKVRDGEDVGVLELTDGQLGGRAAVRLGRCEAPLDEQVVATEVWEQQPGVDDGRDRVDVEVPGDVAG
jgi:hypothetical protein